MRTPLLSILLVAALAAPVAAQPSFAIPTNDGWVTDQGEMLTTAQERELEALMESYRQGSTHEIALLTVSELPGIDVESFALEVARAWGIGRKEENNGALLVVSRADRKLRIEVGRGLEGTLTDSVSGRIIREVMVPEFKAGRFFEGIRSGLQAMHAAIGGRYAEIPDRRGRSSSVGAGCWIFSLVIFVLLFGLGARASGWGSRRRRGSGIWPWLFIGSLLGSRGHGSSGSGGGSFGSSGGGFGGGGFGGFGGGGGFSGGGASGSW